jgi:hypothetical protein
MTSAMTAFAIAVGGVSVACYLLTSRAEKRRAGGKSSRGAPVRMPAVTPRATGKAFPAGSGAAIRQPTVPGTRSMAAGATAAAGVMEAAAETVEAGVEAIEGFRVE